MKQKNIIYNVTINIDQAINNKWLKWMLNRHIPDVMATKCFKKYSVNRMLSPEPESGVTYVIQYICKSLEHYEKYQIEHAAILQSKHKEKFDGKFVAARSLMEEV